MLIEKNKSPQYFQTGQAVRTPLGVGTIRGYENGKYLVEHATGGVQRFDPSQITRTEILHG